MERRALAHSSFFLIFMAALVALAPLSIDAYMPAIPMLAEYYGVKISAVNLTISTYLISSGLGQFLGGALSDHLGRKPIGLVGLLTFVVATMLITLSTTIEQMQLWRFFQGLGGGFAMVICMAQLRDIYPAEEVAKRFAKVMLVVLIAPMVAPAIGSVIMQLGWKAIFVFLGGYGLLFLLIYIFIIPETRLGDRTRPSFTSILMSFVQVVNHRIDGKRVAIRYALFGAITAGVFFSYLTNAAFIYMDQFHLNEYQFSLTFAAGGLAMMAGNAAAIRLMGRFSALKILLGANLAQIGVLAALLLMVFLEAASFWVLISTLLLVLAACGAISPTASGSFVKFYDHLSGSAASVSATLTYTIGAGIGALAATLGNNSLGPVLMTMLGAAVIAQFVLRTVAEDQSVP
ncbi:MAG: DHA1 family bicyclomycin/chloramphenicol resistance-like MFS transporter [Alcanivorax sp.]|jgi:DHA1 family bicyclomycin/chloramphenicol resistance-like MFS transporter